MFATLFLFDENENKMLFHLEKYAYKMGLNQHIILSIYQNWKWTDSQTGEEDKHYGDKLPAVCFI